MEQLKSGISRAPNKITVVIIVVVEILIVIITFIIQTVGKYIKSAFTFVPLK